MILTVDRLGRRNISCSGTTLSWVSCVAIGILGVVPNVSATQYLLVFFACLWSKCPHLEYIPAGRPSF